MRHFGNLALMGVLVGLLSLPIIGFGFMDYSRSGGEGSGSNVLPADTTRIEVIIEEVEETTEVTEATSL